MRAAIAALVAIGLLAAWAFLWLGRGPENDSGSTGDGPSEASVGTETAAPRPLWDGVDVVDRVGVEDPGASRPRQPDSPWKAHGVVTDVDGDPIDAARIIPLRDSTRNLLAGDPVVTGLDGEFEIEGRSRRVTFRVEHVDYPEMLCLIEGRQRGLVWVILRREVALRGRVISVEGDSLAGAFVSIVPTAPKASRVRILKKAETRSTTTADAQGAFAFPALAESRRYHVTAHHDHHLSRTVEVTPTADDDELVIELQAATIAQFRVSGLDERIAESFGLSVWGFGPTSHGERRLHRIRTNAVRSSRTEFLYEVPGLLPGRYLAFAGAVHLAGRSDWFDVDGSPLHTVDIRLTATAVLQVEYQADRPNALALSLERLMPRSEGTSADPISERSGVASSFGDAFAVGIGEVDPDGFSRRLQFSPLPPGTYRLDNRRDSGSLRSQSEWVTLAAGEEYKLRWTLPAGGSVTGVIRAGAELPASVKVAAFGLDDSRAGGFPLYDPRAGGFPLAETQTRADASYELGPLAPGPVELRIVDLKSIERLTGAAVAASSELSKIVTIRAGETVQWNPTLRLGPISSLDVTVMTPGMVSDWGELSLSAGGLKKTGEVAERNPAQTLLKFSALAPGDYLLVLADDRGRRLTRDVTVREGFNEQLVRFAFEQYSVLVTDPTGVPLPGADLQVLGSVGGVNPEPLIGRIARHRADDRGLIQFESQHSVESLGLDCVVGSPGTTPQRIVLRGNRPESVKLSQGPERALVWILDEWGVPLEGALLRVLGQNGQVVPFCATRFGRPLPASSELDPPAGFLPLDGPWPITLNPVAEDAGALILEVQPLRRHASRYQGARKSLGPESKIEVRLQAR